MSEQYERAAEAVQRYKKEASLLGRIDYQLGDELLYLGAQEARELEQEIGLYGTDRYSSQETGGEWADTFNFSTAYAHAFLIGEGKDRKWLFDDVGKENRGRIGSGAIDDLVEVMLNMADDPRAAQTFYARLHVLALYSPDPVKIVEVVEASAKKVLEHHRPPELYQTRNVRTGQEIEDPKDLRRLYHLLEWETRAIRNHIKTGGRKLMEKRDWWKIRELLRDFEGGERNRQLLIQILESSPPGEVHVPEGIVLPNFSEQRAYYRLESEQPKGNLHVVLFDAASRKHDRSVLAQAA